MEQTEIEMNRVHNHSQPSSQPSSQPAGGNEGGKKLWQVIGAMSANLFAVCMGSTMGWTSAAAKLQQKNETGLVVSADSYSWIGAAMPLGAMLAAIPASRAMERWGRKRTLLVLSPTVTLAWLLIIFANAAWMIILARLIIGAAIGSISMIAPLYSKEIAQKSVRGTLGSFFQFLHTCGVLFAYGLGAVISNLTWISVICACVPLVAGALFLIFPDTPAWHLSYNNEEAAKDSLRYFRGSTEEYSNEQLEAELDRIREEVAQAKNSKNRDLKQTIAAFTTREAKMGIMLAMTLMLVQQLSGVSAVIFYAEQIFNDTKAPIPGDMASIVMGACLAGATFVSLFLVDKFGRKLLLLVSGIACIICNVILGVFLYYLKVDEKSVQPYSMVPIVTMSVFMILFSFGYGPIPWSYMTEVFTSDIQGTAISIATITNWLMVFIVTLFYAPLSNALGNYTTFWIFAGIVLLGTVIVALFLVETKDRESWEIQALLRGEKPQPRSNGVVRHDP